MGADRSVHGLGERAATDIGQLLGDDRLVRERSAAAAVLFGNAGAKHAQGASLAVEFAVDAVLFLPALVVRRGLPGEEAADGVAKDRQIRRHPGNRARVNHGTSPRARRCSARSQSVGLTQATNSRTPAAAIVSMETI